MLHKLFVFLQRRTSGASKEAKYNQKLVCQIIGVAAHQEGVIEDPDPAEEDSQAPGGVQGLNWLPRHHQER